MCFGVLLSVICYAMAAEYSRYKREILGPRFMGALAIDSPNPLNSSDWGNSGIGIAINLAVLALWVVITMAMIAVLVGARGFTAQVSSSEPVLVIIMRLCFTLSVISIGAALFSASAKMQEMARKISVRNRKRKAYRDKEGAL
jgi:hypothetical protein